MNLLCTFTSRHCVLVLWYFFVSCLLYCKNAFLYTFLFYFVDIIKERTYIYFVIGTWNQVHWKNVFVWWDKKKTSLFTLLCSPFLLPPPKYNYMHDMNFSSLFTLWVIDSLFYVWQIYLNKRRILSDYYRYCIHYKLFWPVLSSTSKIEHTFNSTSLDIVSTVPNCT